VKLLHCLDCGDLFRLDLEEKKCECSQSGGQYLPDGLHAEYYGHSRILGMMNPEWRHSLRNPPTAPYQKDYKWFVIGHWPGCHINKTDEPLLYNEPTPRKAA
jgi:hypothetical protein